MTWTTEFSVGLEEVLICAEKMALVTARLRLGPTGENGRKCPTPRFPAQTFRGRRQRCERQEATLWTLVALLWTVEISEAGLKGLRS